MIIMINYDHGDDHEKKEDLNDLDGEIVTLEEVDDSDDHHRWLIRKMLIINYLNSGIVALEEVDRLIGLRLADHHAIVVLLVLHVPPS